MLRCAWEDDRADGVKQVITALYPEGLDVVEETVAGEEGEGEEEEENEQEEVEDEVWDPEDISPWDIDGYYDFDLRVYTTGRLTHDVIISNLRTFPPLISKNGEYRWFEGPISGDWRQFWTKVNDPFWSWATVTEAQISEHFLGGVVELGPAALGQERTPHSDYLAASRAGDVVLRATKAPEHPGLPPRQGEGEDESEHEEWREEMLEWQKWTAEERRRRELAQEWEKRKAEMRGMYEAGKGLGRKRKRVRFCEVVVVKEFERDGDTDESSIQAENHNENHEAMEAQRVPEQFGEDAEIVDVPIDEGIKENGEPDDGRSIALE